MVFKSISTFNRRTSEGWSANYGKEMSNRCNFSKAIRLFELVFPPVKAFRFVQLILVKKTSKHLNNAAQLLTSVCQFSPETLSVPIQLMYQRVPSG